MVWFYSMDFRRNWHGNLQGTCDVDYGRSYDENRDFKPWIGPSDKLYSLCASVHGPRMGKQVKRPRSDASPMLWVVLWLLSTAFIAVLMLIMRNLRRVGNRILANPFSLSLSVIFFAVFTWLWVALVIDQMPCFLGGSGC